MSKNAYDPRVKIIIVALISSIVIIFSNIYSLIIAFIFQLLLAVYFKANVKLLFMRLQKVIKIFFFLILIQSIFNQQGDPLLTIVQFDLITDVGLILGLSYVLRLFTILISGSILLTSKQKELIQALIRLKVPYDLAFMSLIGIRFLPLLIEQMQDTFTAIQLRGVDVSELKFLEKIKIYSYVFSPVIVSTLKKAKNLAMSVELRGFRVNENRTSLVELKMGIKDYVILSFMVIVTFGFILFNIR